MEIPQEVMDSGIFTMYLNTNPEQVVLVERYNEKMELSRKQKRSVMLLEKIFLMLNIAMPIIVGVIGLKAGGMFILNPRVEWLEYAVLGLFIAAYIFFGMKKRNLIAVTIFSIPLIIMDLRCALMAGVNIVFTVFHEKNLRILKNKEGYPSFMKIHIEKKNCKEPISPEKSEAEQNYRAEQ